jgi:hypothetical protein
MWRRLWQAPVDFAGQPGRLEQFSLEVSKKLPPPKRLGSIRVPRVGFGVSPNTVFRRDAGKCTRRRGEGAPSPSGVRSPESRTRRSLAPRPLGVASHKTRSLDSGHVPPCFGLSSHLPLRIRVRMRGGLRKLFQELARTPANISERRSRDEIPWYFSELTSCFCSRAAGSALNV